MSKSQILFSTEDSLGQESNVKVNIENHIQRFYKPKLVDVANVSKSRYPRGKTYWNTFMTQLTKGEW